MCCSAFYHLFHCMSESASKKWLRLDLGGISVGLCGCYFPGAYYAFYCHAVSNEHVTKLIVQNFQVRTITKLSTKFIVTFLSERKAYHEVLNCFEPPVIHIYTSVFDIYSNCFIAISTIKYQSNK